MWSSLPSILACASTPAAELPVPVEAPPAPAAPLPAPAPEPPRVRQVRAEQVLFPDGLPEQVPCEPGEDTVRCLVALRFDGHPAEATEALALYDTFGDVVGVEEEQDFDGGFRGTIHLVPTLPVGVHRQHLTWVLAAQRDIAALVAGIEAVAVHPVRYRHRAIGWRFTRSVGRATPSAYATDWEVGYNVSGSLLHSGAAVRSTIFHELFHLNDQEHGQWSRRILGPLVDSLDERCHHETPCLARYAPTSLRVKGGTFYAFQHDNGDIANEYAAELAERYFQEQRAAQQGEVHPEGWFSCKAPENRQAMTALAEEFFGGVDRTGECPPVAAPPDR